MAAEFGKLVVPDFVAELRDVADGTSHFGFNRDSCDLEFWNPVPHGPAPCVGR